MSVGDYVGLISGKADYSVLAHNNIYQGGMSVFGNLTVSVHLPT
ncbi:MAG: hypothetical protein R3B53_01895 [Candidatus Paceibacterota bacterium]